MSNQHERTEIENATQGLNVTAAAEMLGVHPQTVRSWMRNYDDAATKPVEGAQLPYTRFGTKIVRIHPRDLALLHD